MEPSKWKGPYKGFNFLVEIDGLIAGGFTEVSGISAETKLDVYREGGTNNYVHKFPKNTEHPNLVLKKGVTDSEVLWSWHRQVVSGFFLRRNISVVLFDDKGNERRRWNFYRAFPVKWTGPDFKADASSVAVETMELAYEGMERG